MRKCRDISGRGLLVSHAKICGYNFVIERNIRSKDE